MPKKPDFLKGDEWFDVDVSNDFLDFDKPYRPPRYTLERDGVPFADVGEIHIISGKPGNGKTGLMSQLEAATLSGRFGNTIARQVGHKKEGSDEFYEVPTKLLHIDTEQGEDDTIGFKNRVLSINMATWYITAMICVTVTSSGTRFITTKRPNGRPGLSERAVNMG